MIKVINQVNRVARIAPNFLAAIAQVANLIIF